MTGAGLLRANALTIPLRDESVDLIVTSPPYFALRSYRDGGEHYDGQIGSEETPRAFLEALWAATAECWRVLKPTGSLFVNLGDKYAGSGGHNNSGISDKSTLRGNGHVGGVGKAGPQKIKSTLRSALDRYNQSSDVPAKSLMGLPWRYAIGCTDGKAAPDGQQWILRAEMVWSKPNGLPESVTDRVRRSHEQWFHLTKQGRYFSAVDEIREPHVSVDAPRPLGTRNQDARHLTATDNTGWKDHEVMHNPLGKLPGSVWTLATEPLVVPEHVGVDHFAAFPQEWPRKLILGWSPSGICTACGEGRRPVTEKATTGHDRLDLGGGGRGRPGSPRAEIPGRTTINRTPWQEGVERTITGYECACADATAPTRPAVVLDPFGGTGTVAMVARALGRYGVHLDLSADYLRLARWRVFQSGHAAKARERTNREAQSSLWSA